MRRFTQRGFTLVEILIVVAILGILIAVALPGFYRAREMSRARACQANLVRIAGAVEVYALENNVPSHGEARLEDLVGPGGAGHFRAMPVCPSGGHYSEVINLVGDPACSIGPNEKDPRLSHTLNAAKGLQAAAGGAGETP